MKLLITGGAGFIGLNLLAFLREKKGFEFNILDNFSLGRRESLNEFNVKIFEGDIRDDLTVDKAIEGVDIVIHLAADTRVIASIDNPDHNFDVNVLGTYNLLRKSINNKIRKFIYASTGGAILGDVEPPVHEEMVPKPISPYGASKLAGEAYCSAFTGSYGLQTVCLRFSNVYGPRSFHKGSVISQFIKRIVEGKDLIIHGDGYQTRDFVFSKDICEGIYSAITSKQTGTFQLGTGKPVSVMKLIELIRDTVGIAYQFKVKNIDSIKGEIRHTWCDISRAQTYLGFSPYIALPEGLKLTWDWFIRYYRK